MSMSSASSQRGKRASVKKKTTLVGRRRGGRWYEIWADGSEQLQVDKPADWSRLDAMTDCQKLAAAKSDPDAQPLSPAQLKRMRRVRFAKQVRWMLELSHEEFAERFQIPIGTLRDWEQGRIEPDQAARAYLKVIAKDPDALRKALKPAA
jgi:putative transcriptional regulator